MTKVMNKATCYMLIDNYVAWTEGLRGSKGLRSALGEIFDRHAKICDLALFFEHAWIGCLWSSWVELASSFTSFESSPTRCHSERYTEDNSEVRKSADRMC